MSSKILKLDYDAPRVPLYFAHRLGFLTDMLCVRVDYVRYDRTRRGWHVTVKLSRAVSPMRAVAIQAILGSDPNREVFNLTRVSALRRVPLRWRSRWNVFFTAD